MLPTLMMAPVPRAAISGARAGTRKYGGRVATVARVQELAKEYGTPITTLSVAWLLANPAITSVILSASRVEQLADTLVATDYSLDGGLKTQLDEVSI
jgi:aryl-alcohol dehydrogenase-like predicted oxidoreductase